LHQHTAAIHRVDLAPREIQFAKPIERARDRRLRNVEFGGEATHRVCPVLQVASQEHAKLARRQIRAVTAHQGNDGVSKNADQMVGGGRGGHYNNPFHDTQRHSETGGSELKRENKRFGCC